MIRWMEKRMKNLDIVDVGLIKWSVLAFTLFLVSAWPGFANWVEGVNPWIFLLAFFVFVARPFQRFYLKK